ncbi:MAG: hypothetical protein KGQ37_04920 [Hyphomicrobiales bacterium]|nr:hypothetical protein [Hyphomicrobiales bacterium]
MVSPYPGRNHCSLSLRATSRVVETVLVSGARHYSRARILARLLPGLTISGDEDAAATSARIIAGLRAALRRERARAGHWTYSLDRHIGLAQALRAELDAQKNVLVQTGTNTLKPSGMS